MQRPPVGRDTACPAPELVGHDVTVDRFLKGEISASGRRRGAPPLPGGCEIRTSQVMKPGDDSQGAIQRPLVCQHNLRVRVQLIGHARNNM